MEDEADIYDGVRAQFPLTFGKQTKAPTPLEVVHNTTRRTLETSPPASSASQKSLPSLSSSSKAWLSDLRNHNPNSSSRNPNPSYAARGPWSESTGAKEEDEDDGAMVGPARPPSDEDGDGAMIGPPRPPVDEDGDDGVMIGPPRPPVDEEGDDGEMIGPPRPPPGVVESDSEEEVENLYRIPLSNEIVLKGHTKVRRC